MASGGAAHDDEGAWQAAARKPVELLDMIRLAAFLRMSIDGLLDHHPSLPRAVVDAFDIRS
jgi:hypothetical protein